MEVEGGNLVSTECAVWVRVLVNISWSVLQNDCVLWERDCLGEGSEKCFFLFGRMFTANRPL